MGMGIGPAADTSARVDSPDGSAPGAPSQGTVRSRVSPRVTTVGVSAWYAAVTLLFAWPVLLGRSASAVPGFQAEVWPWRGVVDQSAPQALQVDGAASSFPWSVTFHEALRNFTLPAWDWHSFSGGYDLVSDGVSGAGYPVHWAVWLAFDPAHAHDVYVVAHLFLSGLVMHALLRHWGLPTGPSLVGGTVWMLAPFNTGWMQAEMITPVAVTVPLAFWTMSAAMRRPSWQRIAGAAASLALALVAGNIVVFLVLVWIVGLYGVAHIGLALVKSSRRVALARLRTLVIVAVGAFCLAAYSLVPTLLNLIGLGRRPSTLDEVLPVQASVDTILNTLWQQPDIELPVSLFNLGWCGTVALALAVVGLLHRSLNKWLALTLVVFFTLLPLTPIILELGWFAIPPLRAISGFGRLIFLSSFGLAVLAAMGAAVIGSAVTRLLRSRKRATPNLLGLAVSAPLAVVVVAELLPFAVAINPEWTDESDRPFFPVTGAHEAIRSTGDAGWPSLTLPLTPDVTDGPARYSLWGASSHIDSVDSVGGYDSAVPQRATGLSRVMEGTPPTEAVTPFSTAYLPSFSTSWARLDLAQRVGVTHVYAPPGVDLSESAYAGQLPSMTVVHQGSDGTVWALDEPMRGPRLVEDAVVVSSPADAIVEFTSPNHDARATVVLEGRRSAQDQPPAAGTPQDGSDVGTVVSSARSEDGATVRVRTNRASWLVAPIGYADGWTAEVDGEPIAVRPADFAFSAVRVPPGDSTVTFHYRPRGQLAGLALTFLGLLTVAALTLRTWTRRRANTP